MGLQNYEHDWPYFHVGISTTLLMFWLFSNKTNKAHQKWTPHLNCTSFEFWWGWILSLWKDHIHHMPFIACDEIYPSKLGPSCNTSFDSGTQVPQLSLSQGHCFVWWLWATSNTRSKSHDLVTWRVLWWTIEFTPLACALPIPHSITALTSSYYTFLHTKLHDQKLNSLNMVYITYTLLDYHSIEFICETHIQINMIA
jgi:hypothetical protein